MGELLNLVGLSTGVVLYAMLLAMVVRAGARAGAAARFDPLLLATASSGWSGTSARCPPTSCRRWASTGPFRSSSPSDSARSVSCRRSSCTRCCAASATACAARAGAIDCVGRLQRQRAPRPFFTCARHWPASPVPSPLGMRLLTYTFVALVVPLAAVTRGQPGARRALWAAALAIFAVSALHLSQFHQRRRVVAGRAPRPPRVAAARVRDPVSGLSVRARGSVSEARAGAAQRSSRSPSSRS